MGGGDAMFSKIDAGIRACKVKESVSLFVLAVGDKGLRPLLYAGNNSTLRTYVTQSQ